MPKNPQQLSIPEVSSATICPERIVARATIPSSISPGEALILESIVGARAPVLPERSLRQRWLHSRMGRAAIGILTAAGLAATGLAMEDEPARADKVHVFTVDGTGSDGVWLHSDPGLGDQGDLIKVMPEGTRFTADCYVNDTPVGPRDNPVWLHGTDETGATGYFTDYYSSSRWDNNNTLKQQGLPICGETQPDNNETPPDPQPEPEKPHYDAVFYAPGDGETVFYGGRQVSMPVPDNVYVMAKEGNKHPKWSDGDCGAGLADDFEKKIDSNITTLAGWSIGRLGPVYYLQNSSAQQRENIQNILLIDPGDRDELENNPCDRRYDQSATYAKWLAEDKNNRLTILAGLVTQDSGPRPKKGKYYHAGIQNVLFSKIRGTKLSKQVTVCNYPDLEHVPMYEQFRSIIVDPVNDTEDCPGNPEAAWRP